MVALEAALALCLLTSSSDTVLLDFSASWCGPCRQMEPVVEQLAGMGYPVRKVDMDRDPSLAAQYGVTGIPCFVLLVNGREVQRSVGATSLDSLQNMLRAAGVRPAGSAARGQSPDETSAATRVPSLQSAAPYGAPAAQSASQYDVRAPHVATAETPKPANLDPAAVQRAMAASVRLRIEDAGGRSTGSGTIIDARHGEALVLTCGHVFRDSNGKGKILVDLFGPGAPQGLEGQLISYDLKSDVGVLSVRLENAPAVLVARQGDMPARGAPVFSIGCNHGADPTVRHSRVTAIDKYLAPPNIQAAGQPVEGRSGGGLFDARGQLVGVCNAADPRDDEGLYAALGSIHAELDRSGLSAIMASANSAAVGAAGPITNPAGAVLPSPTPARSEASLAHDIIAAAGHAEVICIVRPLDNPRATSEVIFLDRASPTFLSHLAAERQAQVSEHLTSWTPLAAVSRIPRSSPARVANWIQPL